MMNTCWSIIFRDALINPAWKQVHDQIEKPYIDIAYEKIATKVQKQITHQFYSKVVKQFEEQP